MKLRVRIHMGRTLSPDSDGPPFQGMAPGRVPRTGTLLTSVAAHLLLFIVISVISREIALWSRDDQLDWSRYTVEPLRIHLAEPLYFQAKPEKLGPAPRLVAQARSAPFEMPGRHG